MARASTTGPKRAAKTDKTTKDTKADKVAAADKAPRKRAAKDEAANEAPTVAPTKEAGSNSSVVDHSRYAYVKHADVKTTSGRAVVDNDDVVAKAIRGKSREELIQIVVDQGRDPNPKWETATNDGLVRMAIGNVLRGCFKNSGRIKINGRWINNPDYVPPEPKAKTAKAA